MLFYTQLFASKRGPLAKIWLAAHWERKITKAHVFECNLESTIEDIISPQMKIGLRTSSHLLLGVVRIYSRKAKYLLSDCNDALVKIKVAFRPGQTQTDMPADALEATTKAITLAEEFTDFDTRQPSPGNIDLEDNYSRNQCRKEEITLKEDFSSSFLNLRDFGGESHHPHGLMDMTFQSLADPQDNFGDEDNGIDVLDWVTSSVNAFQEETTEEPPNELLETPTNIINEEPMEVDASRSDPMEVDLQTMSETTLLANEEEGFALEPVTMTPNSDRKRLKRKRKLVVDEVKELSNEAIRRQIADYSNLIGPLDMAPPTYKLMKWKETGQAVKLLSRFTTDVLHAQLLQLFPNDMLNQNGDGAKVRVSDEDEHRAGGQKECSLHTAELISLDQTVDTERLRHSAELNPLEHVSDGNPPENSIEPAQDENGLDFSHSGLPSEDSMFVHPSGRNRESQSTIIPTQSDLNTQDREERRLTRKTQKLLNILRNLDCSSNNTTFSFKSLCKRSSRARASSTFFYLLVLKKQQAIELYQNAPYEDVLATSGPKFHES